MLWTRSELKGRAKFLLKQNYWYSVLAALIYTFLLGNGFTYSYKATKNKNSEVETSIQGFHPILMLGIVATVAVVVVISFIVYLAIAISYHAENIFHILSSVSSIFENNLSCIVVTIIYCSRCDQRI